MVRFLAALLLTFSFGSVAAQAQTSAEKSTVLTEDFAQLRKGEIPKGWQGDAFACDVDSKSKKACLSTTKSAGQQWLRLPDFDVPLSGDCEIDIEAGLYGYNILGRPYHVLTVRVLGENGSYISFLVTAEPNVFWSYSQPKRIDNTKPFAPVAVRFIRDGDFLRLLLNEQEVATTKNTDLGAIQAVELGLSGGRYGEEVAKIYSVKVTRVGKTPERRGEPRFGKTLVSITRDQLEKNTQLPEGFKGEGYANVQSKDFDTRCLEVIQSDGTAFLSLPKVDKALNSDFYLEFEVLTHHEVIARSPNQEIHLLFQGANALPAHLIIGAEGEVRFGNLPRRKLSAFVRNQSNHFRLIRLGDTWKVACNGAADVEFTPKLVGEFDRILIGLSPGPEPGMRGHPTPKLFAVKFVSLGENATSKPFDGMIFQQDFWQTAKGKLPEGWEGKNVQVNMMPHHHEQGGALHQPWLELANPKDASTGTAAIPLAIRGRFVLEADFEFGPFATKGDAVALSLIPTKGVPLIVTVTEKEMLAQKFRPVDITKTRKDQNRLKIEKTDKEYLVALNGTEVGRLPLNSAAGAFDRLQLGISWSGSRNVPRWYSISVVQPAK